MSGPKSGPRDKPGCIPTRPPAEGQRAHLRSKLAGFDDEGEDEVLHPMGFPSTPVPIPHGDRVKISLFGKEIADILADVEDEEGEDDE